MERVAPCGWKLMFTGKGRKSPFRDMCRQASGTEKEVQGPSMDLNPKAKGTGLSQDSCQAQARLQEGSSLPTILLPPSEGPPPRPWPLPAPCTPTPQLVGRQAGGFSRGLCRWAVFPEQGVRQD